MLRQILREGLGVTLIGVVIGLAAAVGLSRIMADYVYGIKATDPLTYAAATLVLVLAALAAATFRLAVPHPSIQCRRCETNETV